MFRAGDIFFVHADSLFGRSIRAAETGPGEAPAWANHAGAFVGERDVVEALTRVKLHPFEEVKGEIEVWRNAKWTDDQRAAFAAELAAQVGKGYGVLKLLVHLADVGLGWLVGREVVVFRHVLLDRRYPICSYLVAMAAHDATGYRFGIDPEAADPDTMHDHVTASPAWRLVWKGEHEA